MITLILTRHGQTNWNKTGKLAGSSDISRLTKEGKKQAEKLAQKLNDLQIDYIYSSNLKRAKQTAAIIAKKLEREIIVASEFNERSWGVFEGKNWDKNKESLIELYEKGRPDFRPEKGESYNQFLKRIKNRLDEIIKVHEGQTVLLVSHGGVLRGLVKSFKGEFPEDSKIENASLTTIKIDNNKVVETIINDIDHLS